MFNYSTLPGSSAMLTFESAVSEGFDYTGTASQDETPIYQALNQRLTQLETTTELNKDELQAIILCAWLSTSKSPSEEILHRISSDGFLFL